MGMNEYIPMESAEIIYPALASNIVQIIRHKMHLR